jgi:pimeloyl-ACP methyl ester carboxylesterase
MERKVWLQLVIVLVITSCSSSERTPVSNAERAPASNPAPDSTEVKSSALAGIEIDDFYTPPKKIPKNPGEIIRAEVLQGYSLPHGMRGWKMLYTTTVNDKTPVTAVAIVLAPTKVSETPYPVISWAHGTTGVLQKCMPSAISEPTIGIPALEQVINAGWAIIATDYSFKDANGPHPYFIGEGEARSLLDAVRAAREMPDVKFESRTVVWGHSQGGHAALWTGIIGEKYAPEIDIMGVAAIAPPTNLPKIISSDERIDKRLGPYLASSYSQYYPDVKFEKAIRPDALRAAREIKNLCSFYPSEDPKKIGILMTEFNGPALSKDKNFEKRLKENIPDKKISTSVLIAQGLEDKIVTAELTEEFIDSRCKADQQLEYWTFEGLDHGSIVKSGSALEEPLIVWTKERLENKKSVDDCKKLEF